jgi:hypothetical protein
MFLESEFKSQLYDPRCVEGRTHLGAGGAVRGRRWGGKYRVIEDIKHLRTEFETPLLIYMKSFHDCSVQLNETVGLQDIAAAVAIGVCRGSRKGIGSGRVERYAGGID